MGTPKDITNLASTTYDALMTQIIEKFCDPIISTLGPEGKTVIIEAESDEGIVPHVTKDGVTVAESINFKDRRMQAIASLIKESARKTGSIVGDGTTTSIVLTKAFLNTRYELTQTKSQRAFFEGFDLAYEHVIEFIESMSSPITMDSPLLESIVKIATNNDKRIYPIILAGTKAVGVDGMISAELCNEGITSVVVRSGASIDSNAYISKGTRWEASDNVNLVLVSGPIQKVIELQHVLIISGKVPTVIVAKEFSKEIRELVDINNLRGICNVLLVESEGFARNSKMELLEDLASVFTVAIYSTDGSTKLNLRDFVYSNNTSVAKVVATPTETILYSRFSELTEEAEIRFASVTELYTKAKAETETTAGELAHLKRRLAKFSPAAIIKVGAVTSGEAYELKDRVDDAICAITAAINGGIVPGGGVTLYRAMMEFTGNDLLSNPDQIIGYRAFLCACATPLITLFKNSGLKYDKDVCEANLKLDPNTVYDFKNDTWSDFLKGGIIDPTDVTKVALTNASSVAKTILKSDFMITEWQEDK